MEPAPTRRCRDEGASPGRSTRAATSSAAPTAGASVAHDRTFPYRNPEEVVMSRRINVLIGGAVALCAMAAPITAATAAARVPAKQKLAIVGHSAFKVNRLAFDNQRFSKDSLAIRSGGTVTLVNRSKTM